jgi:hypothetical protein
MDYSQLKLEEQRRKKAKRDKQQPKREVKEVKMMTWALLEVLMLMKMALSLESQYLLEKAAKVQEAQTEIEQFLPTQVSKAMTKNQGKAQSSGHPQRSQWIDLDNHLIIKHQN